MDQPTVILGPVGSTLDSTGVRRAPKRTPAAGHTESSPESAGKQKSADDRALREWLDELRAEADVRIAPETP